MFVLLQKNICQVIIEGKGIKKSSNSSGQKQNVLTQIFRIIFLQYYL